MNHRIGASGGSRERGSGSGGRLTWVAVAASLVLGLGGFLSLRPVAAQAPRLRPSDQASRSRMEYHQDQAVWTNMAEVLNKWESRGWEVFQIVPVQPANPGAGSPMTVAIVVRRPTK